MGPKIQDKDLLKLQALRRKDRKQATTQRRRRGEADPKPLADWLGLFFKQDPEAMAQLEQNQALQAWPRLVGDAAARASRACRLNSGTLTVVVPDPMWMQQLALLKHTILAKYRSEFPRLKIRNIYFTRFGKG